MAANWDFTIKDSHCLPSSATLIASNTGSGINIATDVLLSLSPVVLIHKINRPLPEKLLICVLMSMGVVASVCSVMKTIIVQGFADPTADTLATGVAISTWTVLEELLTMLAACVPAQKRMFQRLLGCMGFSITPTRPAYASQRQTQNGTVRNATLSTSRANKHLQDDEEYMLDLVASTKTTKSGNVSIVYTDPTRTGI